MSNPQKNNESEDSREERAARLPERISEITESDIEDQSGPSDAATSRAETRLATQLIGEATMHICKFKICCSIVTMGLLVALGVLPETTHGQVDSRAVARKQYDQAAVEENKGAVDSYDTAAGLFEKCADAFKSLGDAPGEAECRRGRGEIEYYLGHFGAAIPWFAAAHTLFQKAGDRVSEAEVLNDIGLMNFNLGDPEEALRWSTAAGELLKNEQPSNQLKDVEGSISNNLGEDYSGVGNLEEAYEQFVKADEEYRTEQPANEEDRQAQAAGTATSVHNLAAIYSQLGFRARAIEAFKEALKSKRDAGDVLGEVQTLLNLSRSESGAGETDDALRSAREAIDKSAKAPPTIKGDAQVSLGGVYVDLGKNAEALSAYKLALRMYRDFGQGRAGYASTLNNIGLVYTNLHRPSEAIEYLSRATLLFGALNDRHGEGSSLANLMRAFRMLGNRPLAIASGKAAILSFTPLRRTMKNAEVVAQKSYAADIASAYRVLASLLIEEKRTAEALEVAVELRDQRYFDGGPIYLDDVPLNTSEKAFLARENQISSDFIQSVKTLDKQVTSGEHVAGERYTDLERKAGARYASYLFQEAAPMIRAALSQQGPSRTKSVEAVGQVIKNLRSNGSPAVAVFQLADENELHSIIVSDNGLTAVTAHFSFKTVKANATHFWFQLHSPGFDSTTASKPVYDEVIRPIESLLPSGVVILWSPDPALPKIPLGALFDGSRFLVERFGHAVLTRLEPEALTARPSGRRNAYAFGTTKAVGIQILGERVQLPSLPAVASELELFNGAGSILDGEVYQDKDFTKENLLSIAKHPRPIVHIASHFVFSPNSDSLSFLALGDGSSLSLRELATHKGLFNGVELLTLSACQSASAPAFDNTPAFDGLADVAQRLGARAVVANLWRVNDAAASQLTRCFYDHLAHGQHLAESLRLAQVDLLRGSACGGTLNSAPNAWASFELYGNPQ